MSELSKYLVEQILLEEPTHIKKTIVVYVGRFQPFHKGHYITYSNLVKKFGKDSVYIGTSNKVEKPKSPFNFKEKKQIMTTMFGIPSNKIVEVKNPYAPTEVLKNFDEKTTAFVTVVGEKDASRLGGKYFSKWDGHPTEGYKDKGYVYVSPAQPNAISGTDVRVGLGSGSDDQKQNFFVDRAYPKFNKQIFKLISDKLNEAITLDVEIGDTILMGKFKNKKVVVKSIGKDEHGMPTINGKKVATFRMIKEGKHVLFEDENEDSKYTHIGYGKYKLKGKEDDESAPTFTKDDSGKYVKSADGNQPAGEKKPTSNIFGKDSSYSDSLPDNDPAKQQSTPKQEKDWTVGKDGWEILDDPRAKVKKIRKYTDEELQGETGEYFDNETTKKVAPNAFKDESDMIQKIKDAKPVFLSSEDMQNMGNTDIGDILSASEKGGKDAMLKLGKERAAQYGKDWDRLEKGIEKGNAVPSPLALKDKSGKLHLLAGNTRLMSFTASGKKLPVKVIDYDGEFNYDDKTDSQSNEPKRSIAKNIGRKISGWAEKEKEFFTKGQDKPNSETRRTIGEALRDKAKGAGKAIAHGFKHEVHLFKEAAGAVKKFATGEELSDSDKKAVKDVAIKVVTTAVTAAAMGGLGGGAVAFAKLVAIELVPHVVIETLAVGAGKAALFADTNEDERILTGFMEKITEGLESMEIPDEVMEQIVDKYNATKSQPNVDNTQEKELSVKEQYLSDYAKSVKALIEADLKDLEDTDKIPGGLSANKSIANFVKKYDAKGYYDPSQMADYIKQKIKDGAKVEMEHTSDIRIATEIARDHVWEDLNYYTKLATIESNISEITAMGSSFQNDGNSTTGYAWNADWSDYDNQKYYLDNLEGWTNYVDTPSEYEKKRATDQKLPVDNHSDDKTSKYNRILKYGFKEPAKFSNNSVSEAVIGDNIVCDSCAWSWKIAEGGDDVYMCHRCGHDNNPKLTEGILTEGGAYGHMSHPFDTEINLTFGQLKDIVNRALDGDLELAREKTDGQALAISWVNGRLVAARNKGHLKNRGAGALDIKGVADKFSGRGELEKAYNFAMQDLTKAIKSLSDKQKEKIFKNGACFMNIEVIYPTSVNVIPYGQPLLVFHGTMEYDMDGNAIGEDAQSGKILGGMIKQVEQNVQANYTLQGPPVISLPKSQNLSSKKGEFTSKINKLQKEFGLSDTAGVAEYHQAWWSEFVNKKSPSTLDNKTQMGLVKRWAFFDKGFRLDKNNISDPKVLDWALKIDKEDQTKISKQNLMKFEDIFLGLGAEVLSFTSSVLTVNPDKAIRDMKKRLDQTISDVRKSGDPKKLEKLKLELRRLSAVGGVDKIVPIEGIVFVYNGKTFKLTGSFASLNQLLGIFYS